MLEIKEKVLSLLKDYRCTECENIEELQKKQTECVDKLFIMVYYHPRLFGLNMNKDVVSDFLSQLYPSFFENVFNKYDKTKSNFHTFLNVCIKYQIGFFMQKTMKHTMDESVLFQQLQLEHSECEHSQQQLDCECVQKIEASTSYEKAECVPNDEMKKKLEIWISDKKLTTQEKYKKRAVFILLCKTASYIDDEMLIAINDYLKMPNSLLYYYMERFEKEFINCNKDVENAEYRKTKYFIRYLHTAHLLRMDGKTEYEKNMLEKRLNFSLKHYMNASNFIKNKIKSVSNRTIATITGFSRSCVDRVCTNIKKLLEDIKIDGDT